MSKETLGNEPLLEIRWHGRGGQGVVTACKLLADVALEKDLYFQAFPDYGPERMGAPIRAFTRLSKNPIHVHSQITHPNIVMVLDPTVVEAVDITAGLEEEGMLIMNTSQSPSQIRDWLGWDTGTIFTLDASNIAIKHLGRKITNTPMLGALSGALESFTPEDLSNAIRAKFESKFGKDMVKKNIAAMNEAADQLKKG
jgi:pyruvate ferredoxin oxidoreductase gamma subunit